MGALNWLPGLLGVLGLIVASVVFVRGSFAAAQIAALRGDVSDYANRVAMRDARITEADAKIAALTAEVKALKTERDVLAQLRGGGEELTAIHRALDHHHSESMAAWARIIDLLETRENARA